MPKPIEGRLDAKGGKFALVVSRYHQPLTSQLLSAATDCLLRHGAAEGDLIVVQVPGTFEIPLACQQLPGPVATMRSSAWAC